MNIDNTTKVEMLELYKKQLKYMDVKSDNISSFLYNSLLTFNGILFSAFAIIVSLNPSQYNSYILPYFCSLFIAIIAIFTIILDIRKSARYLTHTILYKIYQTEPSTFKDYPEAFIKNYCEKKPKSNRSDLFYRFLDKFTIVMSLVNLIALFTILYKSGSA